MGGVLKELSFMISENDREVIRMTIELLIMHVL